MENRNISNNNLIIIVFTDNLKLFDEYRCYP